MLTETEVLAMLEEAGSAGGGRYGKADGRSGGRTQTPRPPAVLEIGGNEGRPPNSESPSRQLRRRGSRVPRGADYFATMAGVTSPTGVVDVGADAAEGMGVTTICTASCAGAMAAFCFDPMV